MRTIEMRLIKKELKDDNGHTFSVYYCKYLNSEGEIRYKDVTIKKSLIPEIDKILVNNSVDLTFSLSENKDDKDADIFQSWKSKQQKDGSYKYVKDENGNKIPKFVIAKFSTKNIMIVDIEFPISTWNLDD